MEEKQHQINKILQAVREANPELMELEFGTEVVKDGCLPEKVGGFFFNSRCILTSITREAWRIEELEIIGKEPHLEHLLVAIGKKECFACYTQSNGNLCIQQEDDENKWANYNLTLSLPQNLDQNKELRELLLEIIH